MSVPAWLVLWCWPAARAGELPASFHEQKLQAAEYLGHMYYGTEVSSAGDVNQDGYGDVVVGATEVDRAYVYLGGPDGLDPATEQVLSYIGGWGWFGAAVDGVGDVDGDGYPDVAIGQLLSPSYHIGWVSIFAGGPGGVDLTPMSVLEEADDDRFASEDTFVEFGTSLDGVGDLDADGYADLVVGAPYADIDGHFWAGAAWVYFGGPGGPQRDEGVLLTDPDPAADRHFGKHVEGFGDVDGDGQPDLGVVCIGSPNSNVSDDPYTICPSNLFLYLGNGRDIGSSEPLGYAPSDLVIGKTERETAGYDLSAGGDLDADGYNDALLGADGRMYVYYGGPGGFDRDREQRLDCPTLGGTHCGWHVGGGSDIDADGYDDLVLNDPSNTDIPTSGQGSAWMFLGGPDGVSNEPAGFVSASDGVVSTYFGDYFANDVAMAGDVDGDGFGDLLVGASTVGAPETGMATGAVYLYRPACLWCSDSDGDGAGNPGNCLSTCAGVDGWVSNDDDCDDGDATSQGAVYYPDVDGDGHGLQSGGRRSCVQPAGTVTTWLDCDDRDAAVHPGAVDTPCDGLDTDCDGDDEPLSTTELGIPDWSSCDADTGGGDTGGTQSDSGSAPSDSGSPTDSGTGDGAGDADGGGSVGLGSAPVETGCGCGMAARPGGGLWLVLVGLVGLVEWRRRARG